MNSKHRKFDELLDELPWHMRLRMWFIGFGVRRAIRNCRIKSHHVCYQCLHPIHWNDDADVCIDCGGMNRRLRNESGEVTK